MSRRLALLAPFLALAALSPVPSEPPPSGECRRCGSPLDGVDETSGQTECRACRAPSAAPAVGDVIIGIDHGNMPDTMATVMMRRTEHGLVIEKAVTCKPIDVVCPACFALPGQSCNRHSLGKWPYHRARVDAAGGAR